MSWVEALETNGFTRQIAGDADFNAALHAIELMTSRPVRPTRPRGLIIAGEYGVGKSCLARAVRAALSPRPVLVNLADERDLEKFSPAWMDYYATDLFAHSVLLDDLGAEKPVNDYGVRSEKAGDFIASYHSRGSGRLIVTTNLTTDEIDARYGGRVLSRLKDLCVPLRLTGRDKRTWSL